MAGSLPRLLPHSSSSFSQDDPSLLLLSFAVWPAAHSPAAAAPSHPLHVTSLVRPSVQEGIGTANRLLLRPRAHHGRRRSDYVSADHSLLLPRSTNLKISHARAVTTQRVSSTASGDHFFARWGSETGPSFRPQRKSGRGNERREGRHSLKSASVRAQSPHVEVSRRTPSGHD